MIKMLTSCGHLLRNFPSPQRFIRCLTTCSPLKVPQSDSSLFSYRTHTCGELNQEHIGSKVTLCGWIHSFRFDTFLMLRDYTGLVQILLSDQDKKDTESLTKESVVKIDGNVAARPKGQENVNLSTGQVEIVPENIETISTSKLLPFQMKNVSKKRELIRQQYRYLDIRTGFMQKNLRSRAKLISAMRRCLEDKSFIEVETPTLFRPTPGGAREFIVPCTEMPGKFFSLPQSPQQLKQLLMVGGIDRYYQVARCYRDEVSKSDRQPEFTQMDIEMSFANRDNVMNLTEQVIKSSWPHPLPDGNFPVLTYDECMKTYGIDKPDIRYGMQLQDLSELLPTNLAAILGSKIMKAFKVDESEHHFSAKFKDALSKALNTAYPNHSDFAYLQYSEDQWKIGPKNHRFIKDLIAMDDLVQSLGMKEKDIAILSWGNETKMENTLGKLRSILPSLFLERKIPFQFAEEHRFLWVVDFPLFEKSMETDALQTVHHPFTAPRAEDVDRLRSDPLSVRSQAYDLVLNGQEIGGGSIRIHDVNLQRHIFEILNLDHNELFYLFEALDSGAPPHGGIALGIDRIVSILCNTTTIRDVIAFPKNSSGIDTMTNAPCEISDKLKSEFHIKTV